MDPKKLEEITSRTLQAMVHSPIASALRAQENIEVGLSVLETHFKHEKSNKWRDQAAWIISHVRNEAMDGLDMLRTSSTETIEKHACISKQHDVKNSAHKAHQALYSSPSPIHGAIALQTQALGPFKGQCMDVSTQIKERFIQPETQTQTRRHIEKDLPTP